MRLSQKCFTQDTSYGGKTQTLPKTQKAASRRTGSGRSQENSDLKVGVVLQHVDAGHEGALLGVLERSLLDVLVQCDSSAGGVGEIGRASCRERV